MTASLHSRLTVGRQRPHHGGMTIYLSTQCLRHPSELPAVLELYRMAEIKAIALEGPLRLERENIQALANMRVWLHHMRDPAHGADGLNLAAGDEDYRLRSLRTAEATLDLAARLNAQTVSFMPGYALEETFAPARASRPIGRQKALDQLKKSLDRLANRAESMGVALALTNSSAKHSAMLLAQSQEIDHVLHDLQIPFLGLQLDLDHLANAMQHDRERAAAFVAAQMPQLVALRLHEQHSLPVPGGLVAALLESHAELLRLPTILAARALEFSQLLEETEKLAAKRVLPTCGPTQPSS